MELGRRNLHPDAFTLLLGRRYNRAKKTMAEAGASKGKSYPRSGEDRTSSQLAKEHGVAEKTVRNAGKVAEAVEKLALHGISWHAARLALHMAAASIRCRLFCQLPKDETWR